MVMMSDLSRDLLQEILARVPITSLREVRSTCKRWDALSKEEIIWKAESKQQFLVMMKEYRICLMRFNLSEPSIQEEIGNLFNQVEISQIFHCDGLLLCITKYEDDAEARRLMVWNPYLGQTKWIETKNTKSKYAIGYDNNRNYKILKVFRNISNLALAYEIYDLSSSSWRSLDTTVECCSIEYQQRGVSLKGSSYFLAQQKRLPEPPLEETVELPYSLLCFDFTTERFGKFLPLPFDLYTMGAGTLSSIRDEKLAALCECNGISEVEIWVTTKIEPNLVSWIPFLKVNFMEQVTCFDFHFGLDGASFFIDEEKKLAVVFDLYEPNYNHDFIKVSDEPLKQTAFIFGDNGYFERLHFGEAVRRITRGRKPPSYIFCFPLVCSYVPSLVKINHSIHKAGTVDPK